LTAWSLLAEAATRDAAPDVGLPDAMADAELVARLALEEDGLTDVTSEVTTAPGLNGTGAVVFREAAVLAGSVYADAVVRLAGLAPIRWQAAEGEVVAAGAVAAIVAGRLVGLLRAERPLLNMLQRACGIATMTRAFVAAVAGTRCRILHTRKTTPGLRALEVRAVLAGGGAAHRIDLSHVLLVKDNHWRALALANKSLAAALDAARARGVAACYVEVESREQTQAACAARATRIVVDNQPPETVREWAALARQVAPEIEVEASGGITLADVRRYAEAGADFVSIGALTHSARAVDLALELLP